MSKRKQEDKVISTQDHEALGGATEEQDARAALSPPERVWRNPAKLEKRIEELQAQLAVEQAKVTAATPPDMPVDPESEVDAVFPYSATGFAVRVNGKRYVGKMRVTRKVYDLVMNMLSVKNQIERERMADRGSAVLGSKLDPLDYGSRIAQRQRGRHVL